VPFELQPEVVVDDGEEANLAALPLHGEVAAVVVAELDAAELPFANTEAKEEEKRHPVALTWAGGKDLRDVLAGEGSAYGVASPWPEDRKRRVSVEALLPHL
jgi:hypothetical protein